MSRSTKIWLVAATAFIVLGIIMLGVLMGMQKWDLTKLGTGKFETNNHEFDESFKNISVTTDTSDIIFLPSEDGKCRVVCCEYKKARHAVSVSNDTLCVKIFDERKWYDHIGIFFDTPKITIYLPEYKYDVLTVTNATGDVNIRDSFSFESVDIVSSTGDVELSASVKESAKITLSTGDIKMKDLSVGAVEITVTTGDIEIDSVKCYDNISVKTTTGDVCLSGVTCNKLVSNGSTGDITLENVIADESFNIQRSTGNIQLYGCDASEIFIKTSTGDVNGTLLSEKIFVTNTDAERVKVPRSTTGGICEITTGTGNIIISLE